MSQPAAAAAAFLFLWSHKNLEARQLLATTSNATYWLGTQHYLLNHLWSCVCSVEEYRVWYIFNWKRDKVPSDPDAICWEESRLAIRHLPFGLRLWRGKFLTNCSGFSLMPSRPGSIKSHQHAHCCATSLKQISITCYNVQIHVLLQNNFENLLLLCYTSKSQHHKVVTLM